MSLSINESLLRHLETLRNDFLERFGETKTNIDFIENLKDFSNSIKNGVNENIQHSHFSEILESVKEKFLNNNFIREFEYSNLILQIVTLKRILVSQFKQNKFQNDDFSEIAEKTNLDSQMFERAEEITAYLKTLFVTDIDSMEKNALGWGAGKLGNRIFTKNSFELVEKYAKLLEKNEQLKNLAEKIGKHSFNQKKIKQTINGIKPAVSYDGIYNSDNIKTILSSELALKINPKTEIEFLRKFAEKQLLCYKPAPDKSASDGNKKDKGAAIICLDTSGSMHGIPEALSKAMALLIIKYATKEKREILIISFSVKTEILKIEHPEKQEQMARIIQFLSSSFHGGTNIGFAIENAIEMLSKTKLKNADILTISDFVASDLSKNTTKKIEKIKKNGTRLFAISIGDRGNNSILRLMDETKIFKKEKFV